jgi:hypothetical protein
MNVAAVVAVAVRRRAGDRRRPHREDCALAGVQIVATVPSNRSMADAVNVAAPVPPVASTLRPAAR